MSVNFFRLILFRHSGGKYLPSDIDPSLCTHIIYAFAVLDNDGLVIRAHDTWADFDNCTFLVPIAGMFKGERGDA